MEKTATGEPLLIKEEDISEENLQRKLPMWGNRLLIGIGETGTELVCSVSYKYAREMEELPRTTRCVTIGSSTQDKTGESSYRDIRIALDTSTKKMRSKTPWLSDFFTESKTTAHRSLGKAIYKTDKDRILDQIIRIADSLFNDTRNSNFCVIFITHLGEGIGSGIFAEIVTDLYEELNSHRYNPFFMGIGILPDQKSDTTECATAYATLKELHFLMSQKEPAAGKASFNPFSVFFLVGSQMHGIPTEEESSKLTIDFLCDITSCDGILTELWAASGGHTHQFSALGHFRCQFPVDELNHYYKIESNISKIEASIAEKEFQLNEKERAVHELKETMEHLQNQIQSFETALESEKKKVFQFTRKEELQKIKDQKTEIAQKLYRIEQKIVQNKEGIHHLELERRKLIQEINDLNLLKDQCLSALSTPKQTMNLYTIPLYPRDIEKLRDVAQELSSSSMMDVMYLLNRREEIYQKTHENSINSRVIPLPMLDYAAQFHKRDYPEEFSEPLIRVLSDNELLTITEEGMLNLKDTARENVLIVTAAHKDNYTFDRLNLSSFKNDALATYGVQPRVTSVSLESAKKHQFDIYLFLIGLRPWSPLPELPSRLSDLVFLEHSYQKEAQSNRIALYHGPSRASNLYRTINGYNFDNLRFWNNYQITDGDVQLFHLLVVFCRLRLFIEEIYKTCERTRASFELLQVPEGTESQLEEVIYHQLKEFLISCADFKRFLQQKRRELDRYRVYVGNLPCKSEISLLASRNDITFSEAQFGKEFVSLIDCIEKMQDFYNEKIYDYTGDIASIVDTAKDRNIQQKTSIAAYVQRIENKESVEISIYLEKLRASLNGFLPVMHEVYNLSC